MNWIKDLIGWVVNLIAPPPPPHPVLALFPAEKKDWWYCGKWQMYRHDEQDAGRPYFTREEPKMPLPPYLDRFMINPFNPDGYGVIFEEWQPEYEIACLIKEHEGKKWVGLYSAGWRYRTTSFYDGAPWDDGYHVDLILTRVIPFEEFERSGEVWGLWAEAIPGELRLK